MRQRRTCAELQRLAAIAPTAIKSITAERERIEMERRRLVRAGMVDASAHYRAGKYLYLVHRQVEGARTREYVGVDPVSVERALARIERFVRHEALRRDLDRLDQSIQSLERAATALAAEMSGVVRRVSESPSQPAHPVRGYSTSIRKQTLQGDTHA